MRPDEMLRNGIDENYFSNHQQEGYVLRQRPAKDSNANFVFELGWVTKKGKTNMILMYAYGEMAFRLAREIQTGDKLLCIFYIDSYRGEGYVGVRGILYDYRIYGNRIKTAQYISDEFAKSVTNKITDKNVRSITERDNF